jgi:hypothetical protein
VLGNNQVAFDAVCCHIIGLEPLDVPHIRLAHERGFGPVDLDQIEVSGDVSLDEARERAKGFRVGLVRVEKYFEGTHISAYAGPPPDDRPRDELQYDYCWGGCPGALEEAIEILRRFDAACDEKLPRTHIVFGAYDGPIDAMPGERVIFIGDCARWKGEIAGKYVEVESVYEDRARKNPYQAKHDDIFVKLAEVTRKLEVTKRETHVRFTGCPTSVAEQVLILVQHGRLKNPILHPSNAIPFNLGYLGWRSATAVKRAMGKKYQKHGKTSRGAAKPEVRPRSDVDAAE